MKLNQSGIQLETLVSRILANELDLQPDFQRGEIWDGPRRQRLIDTILRDWYVPAVHIVQEEDRDEVVLDGQQRLAAIRDFCSDKFKVNGKIVPLDPDIEALDGMVYSRLPDDVKKRFRRFMITVVVLSEFEPGEPNELFFRLNQSYNLTPPEKRNALHGEARDSVRDAVNRLVEVGLLRTEAIGFSNSRLAYDDVIARVCVALELNTLREHINNSTVEAFYRGRAFSGDTFALMDDAALILLGLIGESEQRIRFNKGSLQTWLIFCAQAAFYKTPLPTNLLAEFETIRLAQRRGEDPGIRVGAAVLAAVDQYDDRAAYRVTDVSSVLIRDATVHLFTEEQHGVVVGISTRGLIEGLHREEDSPQSIVQDFATNSGWGQPIFQR
jgi:hypothetical protein